jgi:hypothetical protein
MAPGGRLGAVDRLHGVAEDAPAYTVDAAARLLSAVRGNHGKAAFAARALDALAEIAERTDERTLVEAAGAPSNVAALARALDQPEALAEVRRRDPLAPARLRGVRAQDWLLQAEGGTLTAVEIGRALGISRQAVDKRRKRGALIGLDLGRRGFAYPAWQVGPTGVLAGLPAVLAELGDDSAWGQAAFFLTTNVWLDGDTPLAALRRGESERVLQAARLLGDQVAV